MLKNCENVLILVGSAQALGEERNPFNHLIRQQLIKTLYPQDNVTVGFYPDLPMANEDHEYSKWGDWIVGHSKLFTGRKPDAIYSGHRTRNELIYVNFPYLKFETMKRDTHSGAEIRKLLNYDRKSDWKAVTDERLHLYYPVLKGIVRGKISPYATYL